jgi:hypothetical protein
MSSLLGWLASRLAQAAVDRALRAVLPQVFARLDVELPMVLRNHVPPVIVEGLIASAIADAVGKPATVDQIEAVARLFNPVAAAVPQDRR